MKSQKILKLKLIVLLCLSLGINSCGGGKDDEPLPDTSLEPTWMFDDYQYKGGSSAGGIDTTFNGIEFGVLVITTEEDTSNGDFSGSALSFTFPTRGPGIYSVVSSDEYGELVTPESTDKVLMLSCTVGSAFVAATRYEGLSGGILNVLVDAEGRYKFDTQEGGIALGEPLDVSGGVPNRPVTATLVIEDAFNFTNN